MTICTASIASAVICCSNNGNNKKCKSYELSEAWRVGVRLVRRKLSWWRVCGDTQEHNNCIFGKRCLNLLYHKNQVETCILIHVKCQHGLLLGKMLKLGLRYSHGCVGWEAQVCWD